MNNKQKLNKLIEDIAEKENLQGLHKMDEAEYFKWQYFPLAKDPQTSKNCYYMGMIQGIRKAIALISDDTPIGELTVDYDPSIKIEKRKVEPIRPIPAGLYNDLEIGRTLMVADVKINPVNIQAYFKFPPKALRAEKCHAWLNPIAMFVRHNTSNDAIKQTLINDETTIQYRPLLDAPYYVKPMYNWMIKFLDLCDNYDNGREFLNGEEVCKCLLEATGGELWI